MARLIIPAALAIASMTVGTTAQKPVGPATPRPNETSASATVQEYEAQLHALATAETIGKLWSASDASSLNQLVQSAHDAAVNVQTEGKIVGPVVPKPKPQPPTNTGPKPRKKDVVAMVTSLHRVLE